MTNDAEAGLLLSSDEIQALTGGLTMPRRQVTLLRERGFERARLERGKVVLERAHYEAVCRGQYGAPVNASERLDRPRLRAIRGR